jgi:diadenosine tetraphosphate (Ap4A) HIT family hydrolase
MTTHCTPPYSGKTFLRTCVSPDGQFRVGVHPPDFTVDNLRKNDFICRLGNLPDGTPVWNHANFPEGRVREPAADFIYEIANPLPFRGTTFINSAWAGPKAGHPEKLRIPKPGPCSFFAGLDTQALTLTRKEKTGLLTALPHPLKIALAQASTDPEELCDLACHACALTFDPGAHLPAGMGFVPGKHGTPVPDIRHPDLFEVLVNNPYLPDPYKEVMVLRPGIQGSSEIIGEYTDGSTHVFEYLRRNSYIPWGHFASNMAHDRIRYRVRDLTVQDIRGLRHLYYQRVYTRVARQLEIPVPGHRRTLSEPELEALRHRITRALDTGRGPELTFNGALWGWNFGFGFAQSGHRLHASHQMIHQQNALIPRHVHDPAGHTMPSFACGDLVADFIRAYEAAHDKPFFNAYIDAIHTNRRTDGGKQGEDALIIYENDHILLFVPKAQVSEWELQVMIRKPVSHVLAADTAVRNALDTAILRAMQALETLGADMVTGIELSGRFDDSDSGQHLIYSFIPRLPYAPPTFSEAQLRWISGAYPEDVAQACRQALA